MSTTNRTKALRRTAVILCCLLVESVAMCAESPAPEPKKLETRDVVSVAGPANRIDVVPEVMLEQPELRKGLTIDVLLRNAGTEALSVIDPALTAQVQLETAKGERVRPVMPTPFDERRNGGPDVVRLEPGQEHRFTLTIKEIVQPRPEPAAPQKEAVPAGATSATMSSGSRLDPNAPPPVAEPLPAGKYKVSLLLPVTQPGDATGHVPPIRLVATEPVTVSYGPK